MTRNLGMTIPSLFKKTEGSSKPPQSGEVHAIARGNKKNGAFREARLISQALALEEHAPPRFITYSVAVVVGLVAIALVGAAVFPVITSSDAAGIVRPIGTLKRVQHVEGGEVAEVLVRDGDLVQQGQALMRLDPAEAQKRYDQVDAEYWGNIAEAERLQALADGRQPSFSMLAPKHAAMAAAQSRIFDQTLMLRATQLDGLQKAHTQAESQLARLNARLSGSYVKRRSLREEYQIYQGLLDKGFTTKIKYLEAQRAFLAATSDIAELKAEIAAAEAAFQAAGAGIAEFEATGRQAALDRLGELSNEQAQVQESRARLAASLTRLDIAAPTAGYINNLNPTARGAAVLPGSIIAEIVPLGEKLVVEAKVSPRDIGFLSKGQPVKLVVDGFNAGRFQSLQGELTHISPASFVEEDGTNYFRVDIALDTPADATSYVLNNLRPGMVVNANIITGERSLLEYLVRPIYDSMGSIFSER